MELRCRGPHQGSGMRVPAGRGSDGELRPLPTRAPGELPASRWGVTHGRSLIGQSLCSPSGSPWDPEQSLARVRGRAASRFPGALETSFSRAHRFFWLSSLPPTGTRHSQYCQVFIESYFHFLIDAAGDVLCETLSSPCEIKGLPLQRDGVSPSFPHLSS